ncbi:MAG: TetR/AcrR family transcriptional regulator, partial [Myxococcota bacterium]|nr:TetR/AcrR family transcriptional regulator [Myxococcota bacterium]
MTVSAKPRQQRARDTRLRLLGATFEALVEVGYSGTTTQEVCRRAGASRGTLLHHFPSRTELVVAALEHVLSGRIEDFRQVASKPGGPPAPTELVEMLWQTLQGPAFFAWLELTVAARTNPELLEALTSLMERFDAGIEVAARELLPADQLDPQFHQVSHRFAFAVLNGLALDRIYRSEADLR